MVGVFYLIINYEPLKVTLEMVPILLAGTLVHNPFDNNTQCMIYWRFTQDIFLDDVNGTMVNETLAEDRFLMETLNFLDNIQLTRLVFTVYSFILSFLVPLIATWFFYARIIASMWTRRQQFFQGGNRQRRNARVTMLGLAIVAMYTACWLPYWFLQWAIENEMGWTKERRYLLPVSYWAYCTQYLNSALNPFRGPSRLISRSTSGLTPASPLLAAFRFSFPRRGRHSDALPARKFTCAPLLAGSPRHSEPCRNPRMGETESLFMSTTSTPGGRGRISSSLEEDPREEESLSSGLIVLPQNFGTCV